MGARAVTHFQLHDDGTFDILHGRRRFLARATARVTVTDSRGVLYTLETRALANNTTLFARDKNVEIQAQIVADTITLRAKNIGGAPIYLKNLQPLYCNTAAGSSIHLSRAADLLYLHHGWQSWSQTAVRAMTAPEIPYSRDEFFQKHLPFGVAPSDARTSDSFILLGDIGREQATLIGFTSGARHLSQIQCTVYGERVTALSATAFGDGIRLDAGESFQAEPLVICFGDAGALYEQYARRVAANMGRRGNRNTIQGWCSWYYYFGENTAEDVRANMRAIKEANLPLDVILIDDGYETMVGDWTSIRADKFPEGMRVIANEIRASGKIPGIWLAPFGARHDSQLAQIHPEFLLRDELGNPVLAWTHWMQPVYALDLTRPDVLQWLRDLFEIICGEWGYRAFKLDFVFAGALAGNHFDPTLTRAQAYRRGLEIIGNVIGNESWILGCGAPQLASVGLVDAMRVSQDINIFWKPADPANVGGVSTQHAVQNTLLRSPFNQKWWLNDPDCVIVRQYGDLNGMTRNEIRTLASVAALTGSILLDSDNLPQVKPIYLQDLRRVLPALEQTARVREWFAARDEQPSQLELKLDRTSWVLAAINWDKKSRETVIELPDNSAFHVYDFWRKKYLGVHKGRVRIARHAPHQTVVLQCAQVSREPRILASSLHLAIAPMRTITLEKSSLCIKIAGVRNARGEILVSLPPRKKAKRARMNGKRARFKNVGQRVLAVSCTVRTAGLVEIDFDS